MPDKAGRLHKDSSYDDSQSQFLVIDSVKFIALTSHTADHRDYLLDLLFRNNCLYLFIIVKHHENISQQWGE